jgi:hypothetical protein
MIVPMIANVLAAILCMSACCLLLFLSPFADCTAMAGRIAKARRANFRCLVWFTQRVQPHHLVTVRLKRSLSWASA